MKHLIAFLALVFSYMLCGAQATTLVVDNQTPGWLSSKINYGDQITVENLTVTGYINAEDLTFIGTLMQKRNLTEELNLTDVKIVGSTNTNDNSISYDNIFGLSSSVQLERLLLPTSIEVPLPSITQPLKYVTVNTLVYGSHSCNIFNNALWGYVYSGGSGAKETPKRLVLREGVDTVADYACDSHSLGTGRVETLSFPSTLKYIGKAAFANCRQLQDVNLTPNIKAIGFEAFYDTSFSPDTLNLPAKLTKYYTKSFPVKDGQIVVIPETVVSIDNTYTTYNNMTNTYTTWDYIQSNKKYIWVMSAETPPSVSYRYSGFLENSIVYVPKGALNAYQNKDPYKKSTIIEIIPVERIEFQERNVSLYVGDQIQAAPSIYPSNATNPTISWISSDPNVASVDNSGLIKVKAYGVATITAIDESKLVSASFAINAYEHVTAINMPQSISVKISEQFTLDAQLLPIGKTDGQIEWKSNDTSIATVDGNGVVHPQKKGKCVITARSLDGNISTECRVTVVQPVESVALSTKEISIKVGETKSLLATVLPSDANNKCVNWSSLDQAVFSVNSSGEIKGLKGGIAKVIHLPKRILR